MVCQYLVCHLNYITDSSAVPIDNSTNDEDSGTPSRICLACGRVNLYLKKVDHMLVRSYE